MPLDGPLLSVRVVDSAFERALARFGAPVLEQSSDVVFAVDPELRLRYVNGAYVRLAREVAGGEVLDQYPLGARIVDGIELPLREHYTALFEKAVASPDPLTTDYHCPTPGERRNFRCTMYPLDGEGLLMVHGPLTLRPWTVAELDRLRDLQTELLPMCAGCRRVRSPDGEWFHVPQLLRETPGRATHGLCDACIAFYGGE